MSSYYNKLISRTLLLKFWVFSGTNLKTVFLNNYKLLNFAYQKKSILDFDNLIFGIKKVIPVFKHLSRISANILFISSTSIYKQTTYLNTCFQKASYLNEWNVGVLTNFSLQGFPWFKHHNISNQPSLVVFLSFEENLLLLLESKSKNLPTVGLVNESLNSYLIDYPIGLSSTYFYNLYFFSKFFFRYLISCI